MTTQLGSAFRKPPTDYGPLADVVNGMRESIIMEVQAGLAARVADAIAQAFKEHGTPQVTVTPQAPVIPPSPPATVTVTPQVRAPDVIVNVNEDEQGEIDAMRENTQALLSLKQEITQLRQLFAKPVIKEVSRDSDDRIIRVTETR